MEKTVQKAEKSRKTTEKLGNTCLGNKIKPVDKSRHPVPPDKGELCDTDRE
jgi:hypothetical protein